jgi:signal transduction histidine kinase
VELWVKEGDKQYRCERTIQPEDSVCFTTTPLTKEKTSGYAQASQDDSRLETLCWDIFLGNGDPPVPLVYQKGHLSPECIVSEDWANNMLKAAQTSTTDASSPSLIVLPLVVSDEIIGLLILKSQQGDYFRAVDMASYELLAQSLGMALVNQRAQAALLERVKELTCLNSIAQLAEYPEMPTEEILQRVVTILPPAWQYHDLASARLTFDGQVYETPGFMESGQKQSAKILANGNRRGTLEVTYQEEKPELDEGPFLKEERNLINNVASQIGLIVERRETERDKSTLQDQLRHADRLATIGQLAAGVAHELNEPLSSILGFAQLATKSSELPSQVGEDVKKIVTASLHAREIIKKLMLFARQSPPSKTQVNLNQVIEEGLYFLESRCARAGIEIVRSLSPDLPAIIADPGQIIQVLVNLTVNSLQAMPDGGKMTVETRVVDGKVCIVVEDTGIGMGEEVKKQIFLPFFTTKDVSEGTGLGLAVVHGIVTSHRGSIKVESAIGSGTRFEIQLPIRLSRGSEEHGKNGQ